MRSLLTSSLALGVVFMLGASSPVEAKVDKAQVYKSSDSNIIQASHRHHRHHHHRDRDRGYYGYPGYYYYGPDYYGPDYYRSPLCVGPLCIY